MAHLCRLVACLFAVAAASAITPGDLPAAGPIQRGADAEFLAELPALESLYADAGPAATAGPAFRDGGAIALPAGWTMRVYFLSATSSDAAFGFTGVGADLTTGAVVFPAAGALRSGDHVDVTGMEIVAGSLFALAGGEVWFNDAALNADQVSHLQYAPGRSDPADLWFAIALDDGFGGGDRDWDDLRVALRFFVSTPEPAGWTLALAFAAVAAWRRRAWRPHG